MQSRAVHHRYEASCFELGRRMRFWPYTVDWRYERDAVWAQRAAELTAGRWASMASRASAAGDAPLPYIFAGGHAGRDYETLVRAIRGLPVELRVYASDEKLGASARDARTAELEASKTLTNGSGVSRVSYMRDVSAVQFRQAMDEALFVAVPLHSWGSSYPKNPDARRALIAAGTPPPGPHLAPTSICSSVEPIHAAAITRHVHVHPPCSVFPAITAACMAAVPLPVLLPVRLAIRWPYAGHWMPRRARSTGEARRPCPYPIPAHPTCPSHLPIPSAHPICPFHLPILTAQARARRVSSSPA